MASKKKLTQTGLLERTEFAVSAIIGNLNVKDAVHKYMTARGRVTSRRNVADFVKEMNVDADDLLGNSEEFQREATEDAKILMEVILDEIAKYAREKKKK